MQIRASRVGLRVMEVPLSYQPRIGEPRIFGTWCDEIAAGAKTILTLCRESQSNFASGARERLIVFARHPEPGRTKTRLIPALGPMAAAETQRQMTKHTLNQARRLVQTRPIAMEVRFVGGDVARMGQLFGPELKLTPQGDGDLGQRLYRAAHNAFKEGASSVAIIGSDCPQLTAEILQAAFDSLEAHDLVLGPAADGGYYLIGMRHCWPGLFANIDWGGEKVFAQTQGAARGSGLRVGLLPVLSDVDRPEDLHIWHSVRDQGPVPTGSVTRTIRA